MNFLRGMATGLTGCILFFILPLLGLGIMINVTLLNPNFIETEVEKLEITEVAREIITDQIPPEDFAYISGIEDTLIEIKPWANEQAGNIIKGVYDYLLGKAEEIRVTIDMDPLRESLATNLTEVYLENPPEGFDQLPVSEQHQTAADFKQQVAEIIPSAVEFNEEILGPDGMNTLKNVRMIVGYFRPGLWILIALAVLSGLVLYRTIRDTGWTLRSLGIIFASAGIFSLIAFLVINYLILPTVFSTNDLPLRIQIWALQTMKDIMSPWEIYSACIAATGIASLVGSFFLHRKQKYSDSEVKEGI